MSSHLVRYLLGEEVSMLQEYSSSDDNAYFRKVKQGRGDEAIRKFSIRIKGARDGDDIEVIMSDIDDALEDCGYTEDKRTGERAGNYAAGGALLGGLASDSNNVGTGMLVGAGLGLAASLLIKDDGKDVIADHVNKLRQLKFEAFDKLKAMSKKR